MIVLADGEPCRCGSRGCLEMYASGKALGRAGARRAASADLDPLGVLADLSARGELDGAQVGKLATEGYPGAVAAVDEVARWLGVALVNLTNTFNPEMIVVGGAVSALGEMLLRPAREVLRELAMLPNRDQVRVATASLGNSAGLVGGGLVAWQTLRPAG
jgi:glucokinase